MEEIQEAEIVTDVPSSPVPTEVPTEATTPVLNGQAVEQVRFLDYGEIRVVFDAKTGGILGVMPAKKAKKVK